MRTSTTTGRGPPPRRASRRPGTGTGPPGVARRSASAEIRPGPQLPSARMRGVLVTAALLLAIGAAGAHGGPPQGEDGTLFRGSLAGAVSRVHPPGADFP